MYTDIIRGFSLYEIMYFFFIYAFLGWCTEVMFSTIKTKKFVNRGFLNGSVCPIYGVGAVVVLILLQPVSNNGFLVFLLSALVTTLIEFFTGLILELLFKHKWWDYSDRKFNIKGYVCLEFTVLWGIACLFVYDVIHPLVKFPVKHLPHTIGLPLLIAIVVFFIVDIVVSVTQIIKFNINLKLLTRITNSLKGNSNKIGEKLSYATTQLEKKYIELMQKQARSKERILNAFPSLKSKKYAVALKDYKERRKNKVKEEKPDEKD